jgi:hypothetical protein
MKRIKSKPEDEQILTDESIDAPTRIDSMIRLAFDGFSDLIHPVLDKWLTNPYFLLRSEAIQMLLEFWGHQKYVPIAENMLFDDSEWLVRKTASRSLSAFALKFIEGEKYEERITSSLLESLVRDESIFVQRQDYEGLLKILKIKNSVGEIDYFDRNRDVDWSLLQPYLEKYNLSKPE